MVAHAFDPSTWEAEAGGFLSSRPAWSAKWVPGRPGLHRETLSRKTTTKKKKKKRKEKKKKKEKNISCFCAFVFLCLSMSRLGPLVGDSSSTIWVLGLNPGCQAWWQRGLTAKPPYGPERTFFTWPYCLQYFRKFLITIGCCDKG